MLWERKADTDLLCTLFICMAHLQLLPSRTGAVWSPGWAELRKQDYKLHSCAIDTSYMSDNEHFAARDFFLNLGTSAAWIWIMSTAVAFLLNNHQSSGRQRAVGLSEVQNVESPGWYILPHLTTELVVFKAWVALSGPSVNINFPPSPPSLTMLLPLVGKQGKGTWEDARSFPHGEMQQSWASHLKSPDAVRNFPQFLFYVFLQIPSWLLHWTDIGYKRSWYNLRHHLLHGAKIFITL